MKCFCLSLLNICLGLTCLLAPPLRADTIQLVNGDTLTGKLLALNDKQVKLQSEILGEVSIARDKVAAITFGDRAARRGKPSGDQMNGSSTAEQMVRYLKSRGIDPERAEELLSKFGASVAAPSRSQQPKAATPQDVVKQLQTQGFDAKTMEQLQSKFPLLGVPGVKDYFTEKLSGLISGNINLQDLRQDAIKARDGLLDIKKELGPSGSALDGYLKILDNFIEQTQPAQPAAGKGKAAVSATKKRAEKTPKTP